MKAKHPNESVTKMDHIVLAPHTNGQGRLFGGQLMSWLDITGAICAMRHSDYDVVTVKADDLEFVRPAMINDIVTVSAKIFYAGNTSMRIRVCAHVEPRGDNKSPQLICSSIFIYVAIDEEGNKVSVPKLIIEGEDLENLQVCKR